MRQIRWALSGMGITLYILKTEEKLSEENMA
jgi:hypothetical protein